jgi:sigma-B regulation protein RsbU (phosphoserine phosphatase)
MVRALVEELKPVAKEPGQFLSQLNRDLHSILKHTGTPLLTTAFYLVADWQSGRMRFSNAGHPKPLHLKRKANTVAFLHAGPRPSQPALGLFEEAEYTSSEVALTSGDLVMLFTDGLYEVHNSREELYTQDLLVECLKRNLQTPAHELFDLVLNEIRQFSDEGFSDDVCLVGMECAFGNVE